MKTFEELLKHFSTTPEKQSYDELSQNFGIGPDKLSFEDLQGKATQLAEQTRPMDKAPSAGVMGMEPPKQAPVQPATPMVGAPVDAEIEELKKAQAEADQNAMWARIIRGSKTMGAAIAGVKEDTAVQDEMLKDADSPVKKLKALREAREQGVERKLKEAKLKDDQESHDPNSAVSKEYRRLAQMMGVPVDTNATAASLSKLATIHAQIFSKREASAARKHELDKKQIEKDEELYIPTLGQARTKDDAKKLKDALEQKTDFDSKLSELIDLRKSRGAEFLDREAVARAGQLSKELLLKYKDLSKLGVLSKADEAILNKIIPADPLEFSSSQLAGQDSILSNLEKFKADINRDYTTKVATRIKKFAPGAEEMYSLNKPETKDRGIAKKLVEQPTEVKRKTADGKIAIFDAETKKFLRYE